MFLIYLIVHNSCFMFNTIIWHKIESMKHLLKIERRAPQVVKWLANWIKRPLLVSSILTGYLLLPALCHS